MEFWGVEVKAGVSPKVNPGDDMILHLSQASLGEVKNKGNESVPLYVKIGGQKLVIGTLSPEKCTQITFDLVFEKEFELSHNWKNGSVYFTGYKSVIPDDESDSEEDIPLQATDNGKPAQKEKAKPATEKANAIKTESSAAKPKVKIVEPEKGDKSKEDDDEDDASDEEDDDDDSEEDESDDEDMLDAGDDDESSDEEDEETPTPKKVGQGKKRPMDSATKTPASDKKAILVTPQKTGADGKKGSGHTATPYPNKQAAKTSANSEKSKGQQTPKSGGQFSCKSCNKSFNSDIGLQSHNKAKHEGGK